MPRVRSDLVRRALASDRTVGVLLFLSFVAIRWPLRSQYLVNWDAVNFALGIEAFDLTHHQPHPPGYLGYIGMGRIMGLLFDDPNTALVAVSVLAGALLPVGTFLLARRMVDRRTAIVAAALLGTSPIVWYYSVVALTYVVAGAVTVFLVWAAHVARHNGSRRHLLLAAVLGGVLGSLRQTDLLFLLPVLIWGAWRFPLRQKAQAVLTLGATCMLWLVPLLWLSGGLTAYLDLSRSLAQLAGGRTWVLGLNPVGMTQNFGLVLVGVVLGLNVLLLAVPLALLRGIRVRDVVGRHDRHLLLLWVAPALSVFLLVHTGQIGYVLLLLPSAQIVAAALAARLLAEHRAGATVRRLLGASHDARPHRNALATRAAAGVALLGLNSLGFFVYPAAGRTVMAPEASSPSPLPSEPDKPVNPAVDRTRQYHLRENDAFWSTLIEVVERNDAQTTAVLTFPDSGGAFRHLAYYAPDHCVYAVGRDLNGGAGHLFTAAGGTSDYAVEGLEHARTTLPLPEGIEQLIIPDVELRRGLDHLPQHLFRSRGVEVAVVQLPPDPVLVFDRDAKGIIIGAERRSQVRRPSERCHSRIDEELFQTFERKSGAPA